MAGQDSVLDIRNHAVFIADNTGQDLVVRREHMQQIGPHLFAYGKDLITRCFQVSKRPGFLT